jgi:hypothetical protein
VAKSPSGSWAVDVYAYNNGIYVDTVRSSSSYSPFRIDASGRPYAFEVRADGQVRAEGVYDNTWAVSANVAISGNGTLHRATSSARFKKNIRELDFPIDAILNLVPKSFEDLNKDTTSFGLIAEEVYEDLPQLVDIAVQGKDPLAQIQTVYYDRIGVLLIPIVKEQKNKIEVLEQQVSDLTAKIEALELA